MAVADFPGKADHYKRCLSIIGDERPGIKTYIETGQRAPPPPARRDIPVGLQNIGNTCYLNSILQYLYSIKPLREAVMSFEDGEETSKTPPKPEVERSRRFVRQLRFLFLQLYKSDFSSVRPEEELAYLAITRPEVDAIVESPKIQETQPTSLDSIPDIPDLPNIPDMPSPTSTAIGSPESTPTVPMSSLPGSPGRSGRPGGLARSQSVLGKRQSEDQEDLTPSPAVGDRTRLRSETMESEAAAMEVERENEAEQVEGGEGDDTLVPDTSPVQNMSALQLKSPESPAVPPPLPQRPAPQRKDTLASGLRFGLQQDSAEVLINVLTQLEMAFDPLTATEGEEKKPNLISDLFSCKYRQQTFYESSDGGLEAQTPVESVFVHPIIGVEEQGKDLYDCLGELYLRGDEIEYEGKKGRMMDLMETFPPMLYIQMRVSNGLVENSARRS